MRHPHPLVVLICLGLVAVAIISPFARRDDWLGWTALLVVAAFALLLWAILVIGATRTFLAWYRDKPVISGDPRIGQCYGDYPYALSWDHESISVHTFSGELVVQVPLTGMLDVIDLNALILNGDVVAKKAGRHITFPKSRSARCKILRLIESMAVSCSEVRCAIENQRAKFSRQSAQRFAVSLLAATGLVLFAIVAPEPKRASLLWAVLGIAYGLAWYCVLWTFAYSVAQFSGARRLQVILGNMLESGHTIQR